MPPVNVEEANLRVGRPSLTGKATLERYYGYDPAKSYLIRSRNRNYIGRTNTLQFLNGTTIAPAKSHESEEWKWNRGEKLSQLASMGYAVYEMGREPAPEDEPMWRGQEAPVDAQANDFGMDFGVRREVPREAPAPAAPATHEADGLGQPAE